MHSLLWTFTFITLDLLIMHRENSFSSTTLANPVQNAGKYRSITPIWRHHSCHHLLSPALCPIQSFHLVFLARPFPRVCILLLLLFLGHCHSLKDHHLLPIAQLPSRRKWWVTSLNGFLGPLRGQFRVNHNWTKMALELDVSVCRSHMRICYNPIQSFPPFKS